LVVCLRGIEKQELGKRKKIAPLKQKRKQRGGNLRPMIEEEGVTIQKTALSEVRHSPSEREGPRAEDGLSSQ